VVDINEIYKSNSDYIKAEDIGNNMWTMTIKTADVKKFDDGTSKIILTFNEWEKCLPLNVTNAKSIAGLYGHNSNDWIGRQVMLFTMMVDYAGKQTLGIRVRAPMQPSGPTQPAPQPSPIQTSPQRPLGPAQPYSELNPPPANPSDYGGIS
jgi:hypothetical protein